MGVTLRQRTNKDGTISLRLDIHHNGQRWPETLDFKLCKAKSKNDRANNKTLLIKAQKIAAEREEQLDKGIIVSPAIKAKVPMLEWMTSYCNAYKKKDKRNMKGATARFALFLVISGQSTSFPFGRLSTELVEEFWEYLKITCKGEGDKSYFYRFKKMMKAAYKADLMVKNVAADVKAVGGGIAGKKDILTQAEIQKLAETPTMSLHVKLAFLFCCVTGFRWQDVKALNWRDIDFASKTVTKLQGKTQVPVTVPLNKTALQILMSINKAEGVVFKLPSANGANKTVKAWVRRAGINKKITWHNARHSFATNLIFKMVDILTTSKLLGHTTLRHVYRYVDSADQMRREAVLKLELDLKAAV